jgi:outer membrane protein assembly factor BamD
MSFTARRFSLWFALPLVLGACGGGSNSFRGMDAPALYRMALEEYQNGEYDDAIRALDRLLVSHGDWEQVPDARMLLAHAHYGKEDYLTARAEYMRFLDRYSGHPDAPKAALGVCKSLAALSPEPPRDQSFTQDAMTVCRNVVIDYSGSPEATEAVEISNRMRVKLAQKEMLTAEFYFRRKLYDSAIKYYEFVANGFAETEYAPQALLGIYLSNQAIGYDDIAEEARKQLLERYPDSEAAAQIRANVTGS